MNSNTDATAFAAPNDEPSGSIRAKIILAVISFALMSWVTTWQFGLLVLVTVGFHEQGHVWAMRSCGIPTKGFYFLPFVGGVALATEQAKTQQDQVWIVLMGPIWGFAQALAVFALYLLTGSPFLAAVASFMAAVNLFNLAPINPLDGGRLLVAAAGSIHPRLGYNVVLASVLACGLATAFGQLPLLLGGLITWACWKESRVMAVTEQPRGMSRRGAIRTCVVHVVLALMLFGLMRLADSAPGSKEAWQEMLGKPPVEAAAETQKK